MSYKIERSEAEYELLMKRTLMNWNYELDLYLISEDGQKVFTNKALLSFYSETLRELLQDPVVAFSFQVPSISVPASFSCVTLLLKILVEGKALTSDQGSMDEVMQLAKTLGIRLLNIYVIFDQEKEVKRRKKVKDGFDPDFAIKNEPSIDPVKEENFDINEENLENISEGNEFQGTRIYHFEEQWECEICHRSYKEKRLLLRHKNRYHKNEMEEMRKLKIQQALLSDPNACEVCGKVFKNRYLLRYHRRSHKEKTHQCHLCPKMFRNAAQLRRHGVTHLPDSEKPFECEVCLKRFCELVQKKNHMMKYHGTLPPAEGAENGSGVNVSDFLSVEVDQNDSDYDMDEDNPTEGIETDFANDMVKKESTTEIIETEFIKSEVIEDNGSES